MGTALKVVPLGGMETGLQDDNLLTMDLDSCIALAAVDSQGRKALAHVCPWPGYPDWETQYSKFMTSARSELESQKPVNFGIFRPGLNTLCSGGGKWTELKRSNEFLNEVTNKITRKLNDDLSTMTSNFTLDIWTRLPAKGSDWVLGSFEINTQSQIQPDAQWYNREALDDPDVDQPDHGRAYYKDPSLNLTEPPPS